MMSGAGSMTSPCHREPPMLRVASCMSQSPKQRPWAGPVLSTSMSVWRGSLRIERMTRAMPSSGPSSHWKKLFSS
jgi:hypothetical protein